jgi:hypothetical protein
MHLANRGNCTTAIAETIDSSGRNMAVPDADRTSPNKVTAVTEITPAIGSNRRGFSIAAFCSPQ